MKNLKAPSLLIALLLNVLLASAETSTHPPSPMSANTTTADEDCAPPNNCEANFPIDQNIVFLVIGGLALGLATIYNKNQTKKASI